MNSRLRYLGLLLVFLLWLPAHIHAAKLKWDRTEARLEMTPDQEEVEATFTVTNDGDETLRIARIKTSCGCTGSIVDRKIMQPGDSTEIVARFNKGKRKGKNHTKLQVFLDSQPDPVATLHMIIDIPTLIEAQPAVVYWSPRTSNTPRQVRITLDKRYINEIEKIRYDTSLLTISEEKVDPKAEPHRIIKVEPKDFTKPIRTSVTLVGKGPDGRSAESEVLVFVQP